MSSSSVARRLFEALHRANVRYCSWKSNDHLAAGLAGATDLDILVDRRQYSEVQLALVAAGLKRGAPGCGLTYPAREGWLGFDDETGRFLYVDLHYRLILGEERLKGYRFPWEELLLGTRRWEESVGVYVADPNAELVLLFVRAALQLPWGARLRERVGRSYFTGNWARQLAWLRERVDPAKAEDLCRQLLGPAAAVLARQMLAAGVTVDRLRRFRRAIRPVTARYRTYAPPVAWGLLLLRRLYAWVALLDRRLCGRRLPFVRKGPAAGGALVVLIGPDSSGKSTVTRELATALGWKLDVVRAYLGAGDGASSLVRWPLVVARRALVAAGLLPARRATARARGDGGPPSRRRGGPFAVARTVWALALALEKRRKLTRVWRARDQGLVVLCDRYPQAQILGFNDGPLLADWLAHPNPLLRALARWELAPYARADQTPPDLVVRLMVTPETAIARDATLDRAFVERRIAAVTALRFGPDTPVVEVDADRPLAEVLRDVTRAVWRAL